MHPAKALYEEVEALRNLVRPGASRYKAEYGAAIKASRERILAYTRAHAGEDLDSLNWGNAFKSIYLTSTLCEWKTEPESNANLRNGWEILSALTPQDPQKATDLCLDLASWHIQGWATGDPEACAACLDEAALRFLPKASPDATRRWRFVAPFYEEQMSAGAAKLPPERRAAFQQTREKAFLVSLQDETMSLTVRSDQLASYAGQLYGQGEAGRAASLLEDWWDKYGEKIESAQFYSARFHTACYGTGDWTKARDTLRRLDKAAAAGAVSREDGLYRLVVGNYYKNIVYPEYELKRRAALLNQQKMQARNTPGK
ncbi:MAG TPA: hypothetical protein VGO11_26265 [Chthoniobacteraceae bacterium]|nr:hypothetical protein [Chthoniobacteraceae bacterium]